MSEKPVIVSMSTDPKRISIPVSDGEHRELFDLARRSRTSVSSLGHLALAHLLLQARNGALPMLPPSTLDNATEVTCLGREV